MSTRDKSEGHGISLAEAVETLTTLADLDLDINQLEVPLKLRTQLGGHSKGVDIKLLRDVFKVILDHFKNVYAEQKSDIDEQAVESIKTIMVLVGEASKKLDKLTNLFHQTKNKGVADLKEYKQLQEFYHMRIARKIDENTLSRWILGLAQKAFSIPEAPMRYLKEAQTKHVFIDLEGVKRDSEYELFFIRKEDGTRFFSPRLIRNIKLVSDFGTYFKTSKVDDPLVDHVLLQDRCIHACAKNMMDSINPVFMHFFRQTLGNNESALVAVLRKACMALMLAGASQNLLKNEPTKTCSEYFEDFQFFLRDIFKTHEYQNLMVHSASKRNEVSQASFELIQTLCTAFFVSMHGFQEAIGFVHHLVQESVLKLSSENLHALKKNRTLTGRLETEYEAMSKLIKDHTNSSLDKIMGSIEGGFYRSFDPLWQKNLPAELFHVYVKEQKIVDVRLPAPIYQEFIHKAYVTDEFRAFVHSLSSNPIISKFLLVNFQDRTSWREHARTAVLEELQNQDGYERLCVVTIPKDTEFYHQEMPYAVENHADLFITSFKEQLKDQSSGFYFPEWIQGEILDFIDGAMNAVHSIFFSSKNVLVKEQRLDFIEIFYFFLQLKLIDIIKPDAVSFTCKDAVDTSGASNAQLFAFLKLLNQERLSESDMELLDLILYASPLMVRERLMNPDRFNRFVRALNVFESTKELLGIVNFQKVIKEAFENFYHTSILEAKVLPSISKTSEFDKGVS